MNFDLITDSIIKLLFKQLYDNFNSCKLADKYDLSGGYAFKSNTYEDKGVFVLRVTNINKDSSVSLNDSKYLSQDNIDDKIQNYLLKENEVLIVMVGGSLGKVGYVTNEILPALLNQNMWRMNAIDSKANPRYTYYLAKYLNSCKLNITKSTHGHLSREMYRTIEIPDTSIDIQNKIALFLDELINNKILNSQILPDIFNLILEKINKFILIDKNIFKVNNNINESIEYVKQLRQAILQEAVQGKLVPQDPNDEPASELLKKIKAEKEKLIKEGKIKKEKPLPPITESEKPYNLPQSWEWCRINDYSDIGTGTTPTSTNTEYYNGNINWVTSTLTSYDFITSTEKTITQKAVNDFNLKIYPAKTLIIALYGQGKTRGQISELAIPSTINQACASIRNVLNDEILKSYTKLFFKKHYEEIRELAAGCAQPNLNVGKIKSTLIPLPPLEEQKRIVQKVNELTALCDELEEQIKQSKTYSEQLMQSILQEAFNPEPAELAKV